MFSMLNGEKGDLNRKRAFKLAETCLSCGRCADACTQGVSVSDMVARVRREMKDSKNHLWNLVLSKQPKLTPARMKLLGVAEKLPVKTVNELVAQARAMARGPLDIALATARKDREAESRRVMLFPGCTAQNYKPHLKDAAGDLLKLAGHEISGQSSSCCGFPLNSAGLGYQADRNVDQVLADWRNQDRPDVAVFCASCRHGLVNIPKTTFFDAQEYEQWLKSVGYLSEMLNNLEFDSAGVRGKVHYHVPCHDTSKADQELMARIFGDRLMVHDGNCCGFGGVFRLKSPDKAARVSRTAWKDMDVSSGDFVLSGCSACSLRLSMDAPEGAKCRPLARGGRLPIKYHLRRCCKRINASCI